MRFILQSGLLALFATGLCAPTAWNNDVAARIDKDLKVIYPDYRRSVDAAVEGDQDAKVIYPDYRRSIQVKGDDSEDSKVIYPDY